MKNCVIIPCFNRPEFLYYCLRNIENAEFCNENIYLFCLDHGFDAGILEIINGFKLSKVVISRPLILPKITKQSRNVLEGYRFGCLLSDSIVYLIEDDIMIATDFFSYHKDVLANEPDCFCSIGTRNNNTPFEITSNADAYYYGAVNDYQSLGVAWRKQRLINDILPHANNSYYLNPQKYVKDSFPQSAIGHFFCEQDGLIRRVKEQSKANVIFPHVPRAYHAGFYSYNRNLHFKKPNSLQDRIKFVGAALSDHELYRKSCGEEQCYKDSIPCNLNTNHKNIEYVKAKTI